MYDSFDNTYQVGATAGTENIITDMLYLPCVFLSFGREIESVCKPKKLGC